MRRKAPLYFSLIISMLVVAACSVSPMPTEVATVAPPPAQAATVVSALTQSVAPPTEIAPTEAAPTEAPPTEGPIPPTITASVAKTVLPPTEPSPTTTPSATAAPQVLGSPAAPPSGKPIARLSAGQPITVTTLHMFDANTGWAVAQVSTDLDSHIVQTADGAKTWRDVTPPEPASVPVQDQTVGKNAAAFFMSAQDAWVAFGYPPGAPLAAAAVVTWVTHDGGNTWSPSAPLKVDTLEQYWPSDMDFVDSHDGWLLVHTGAGMSHDYVALYATQDGGATWSEVVDPMALPDNGSLAMSCQKTGMTFVDAQHGWVSGNCYGVVPGSPYLYQTADGGHTWQQYKLQPPADVPDLFTNENNACGTDAPLFVSPTEGKLPVSCQGLTDNQSRGWLYTTADGGNSWTARPLPTPYGDLQFLDVNAGWWLGGASPTDPTVTRQLYATQDDGQTWTLVKKGVNWNGQVDFVDAQTGWVVAKSDQATALVSTSDGGQKWNLVTPQMAH